MAHFAEIDENNIVKRVIVISNDLESIGSEWCQKNYGGVWLQTSYNSNIRKNYAGIGFYYDSNLDAFIPPKPFNSWILEEETCKWKAPVEYPKDDKNYFWNENIVNWELLS
jgi:hypothetical protein